jgi:hypothetical protein
MLDKRQKVEYPTYVRTYVRRYLSTLSYHRYLYVKLRYATYVTLRLTLGTVLFVIILVSALVRFAAKQIVFAAHTLDDKQEK